MCDLELKETVRSEMLHRSAAGSLGYCPGCGAFGLTFGSLHVRLAAGAVLELSRKLESLAARPLDRGQRHLIHFRGTPATLALSLAELSSLGSILRDGRERAQRLRALETEPRALDEAAWVH